MLWDVQGYVFAVQTQIGKRFKGEIEPKGVLDILGTFSK